uniref:Phototropic-responsive NPH3 family protein n=1 Tax=Kalanchoe fedtschenkoi TaxID=63787 RepID=A0A7N1A6C8_KALFE
MMRRLYELSIFSDVASDVTVDVDGDSFLLHKFPLVAHSGKIRKLVAGGEDLKYSKLELANLPGGSAAFDLSAKFCYGINFEIVAANVASLRCAAEYLEMTDEYREENLIARTEAYINEVVIMSFEKSVEVLATCHALHPTAEELKITSRCVEAIAANACKEQLASGLSRLECDDRSEELIRASSIWWVEDLSVLPIDFYEEVVYAMERVGVDPHCVISSIMHYAEAWLKGVGKCQLWNPARTERAAEKDQKKIMESLITLLPADRSASVPLSFLFGMLRLAIMVDAAAACRVELEKRISVQLELVELDDLLVPSARPGESLFDVDTVHRILLQFMERIQEEDYKFQCGYDSEGAGSPSHSSVLKVGRLMDSYLAEIAPDPSLSVSKFMSVIEVLPDYARVIDDGLYRAVDIYLKAHPTTTEQESRRLCKFIDCQKLSQEASSHAALNDRLPVHMTVRVLYFEQLRLKSSVSGSSGDGFPSQRVSSGVPSAAMSPRDNYASLRRENRELKLEIARMRVRLSDLEKAQVCMKQGMNGKSATGHSFFASLSKGIEKMGIFSSSAPGGKRQKSAKKSQNPEGKICGSRRHSSPPHSYY